MESSTRIKVIGNRIEFDGVGIAVIYLDEWASKRDEFVSYIQGDDLEDVINERVEEKKEEIMNLVRGAIDYAQYAIDELEGIE